MSKKIFAVILVLVLAMSLVFTACSNDEYNKDRPHHTDTIRVYYGDPASLDPALCTDIVTAGYMIQMYSGLVSTNAKGQTIGDIAQSWQISADGTVYTFNLRQNVFFHNGHALTAADFKWSWERALWPGTGSKMAKSYLGHIVGADDILAGTTTDLSGARVLDNYTLQVTIKEPLSYFLAGLAYPVAFALDQKQINSDPVHWIEKPAGTGPFALVSWLYGQKVSFQRFDDFYGQKASIKNLEFITAGDRYVEMFEDGLVNITQIFTIVYMDKVLDPYGPFISQLQEFSELYLFYLAFNQNEAPFDDPLVRQAFAMALDINKVVSTALRGMGHVASGIVPDGIAGYDGAIFPYKFDIAAAKELLAKSSYGSAENLPVIYLTINGSGNILKQEILAIAAQWEENLGVKVRILQLESLGPYGNTSDIQGNILVYAWLADYAHPQNFLEILLASYASNNVGQYNNVAYDELIRLANSAASQAESYALYKQAEALAMQDLAVIPILFGSTYVLVDKNLNGYEQGICDLPVFNTIEYKSVL